MEIAITLVLLLGLLVIGMPVGFAIGTAGVFGLYLVGGDRAVFGILETAPHTGATNYSLMAIPMFILMAQFIVKSGVAAELFDVGRVWVGRTPGGLGIATSIAGALFAALSGSSTASAATLSGTALPEMVRNGYRKDIAGGLVAVVGTLAMMIPPSIALILYGILANVSVGSLLIAGIVPGGLITVTIIGTLLVVLNTTKDGAPVGEKYQLLQKVIVLKAVGPFLVLFLLVTGVIYLGVATPTEASALGAGGALVISLLRRKISFRVLYESLVETTKVSVMIMTIVIGAHIFGYFLALTGITDAVVLAASDAVVPPIVIIFLFLLILLIMGCLMDQIAILALTVPVMAPVASELGFDLVWFGVLIVLTAELGMITPPFGMNAFIVSRYTGEPVATIFKGITPFVVSLLVLVVVLTLFPSIILLLPNMMVGG